MRLRSMGTAVLLALLAALLVAAVVGAEDGPAVDWSVIAGGGAPSAGGAARVNDTLGQPIIGESAGGAVGLEAGYWVRCAAGAVTPALAVARDNADVQLAWSPNPANAQVEVWVSADPYFDPAVQGTTPPVLTTGTTYTDVGAAASLVNHFYVLRGLTACGQPSANSNRAGEFTFGLTAGM